MSTNDLRRPNRKPEREISEHFNRASSTRTYFELSHEHLEHAKEFTSTLVCDRLLLETSLECSEEFIKSSRLNDRPWNDSKFPTM